MIEAKLSFIAAKGYLCAPFRVRLAMVRRLTSAFLPSFLRASGLVRTFPFPAAVSITRPSTFRSLSILVWHVSHLLSLFVTRENGTAALPAPRIGEGSATSTPRDAPPRPMSHARRSAMKSRRLPVRCPPQAWPSVDGEPCLPPQTILKTTTTRMTTTNTPMSQYMTPPSFI